MADKIDIATLKDYDDRTILLLIATTMNSNLDHVANLGLKVDNFISVADRKMTRDEFSSYSARVDAELKKNDVRLLAIEEDHKRHSHASLHKRLYRMENKWENQDVKTDFFLGLTSGTWKVILIVATVMGWIAALSE